MGTTACCHQESSPEPPHAMTSSSSSSPSTAAQATIVFLSSIRSHSHRPCLNRSPDEAARARARVAAVSSPSPPANFPVSRRRPPSPPSMTAAGDSLVTRSIRRSRLGVLTQNFDLISDLKSILAAGVHRHYFPIAKTDTEIDVCRIVWSAMSGSLAYGVASHTSLSDSPVAHPSLFPFSVKSSSFVLRLTRFSPDVQQLRDVQVRQFSQELSVSSVMISRLSRSEYVMFLPPAHFKQSFHEFVTGDYVVCDMSHWLACVVVCTSILTILEVYLFGELVEIAFELGCSSLRCVDVGVTLCVAVMLGGPICSETHHGWSYVFTMSSLGWIGCHGIE
uniref:Uncharacterized protein n=1 Tax=Brassica oleracea var. oleracea TaxID=109376 RepID=A0A0D3DAM2_BRAOL